ncbi:hypothetical protein NDU88_002961 [Pleurodeles waltl]|uniref:Uncharacterized protein n=1 Tax=Pleurodeles waltl TaxID=8319 RepID=A0AAV7V007_PLEWA|nr:hypothetical protein NDU88_002961 [Pleurodeles waltl]
MRTRTRRGAERSGCRSSCALRTEHKCRNRINWPPQPQRNTKKAQSRRHNGETEAAEGPIRDQTWGPVNDGELRSTAQSD